jgi:imidazolonepropionase
VVVPRATADSVPLDAKEWILFLSIDVHYCPLLISIPTDMKAGEHDSAERQTPNAKRMTQPAGQDLVVANCGQLLTLAGSAFTRRGTAMRELGMLKDAAMLVRDGRIVLTGTWKEIQATAGGSTEELNAAGRLVTPGFVDAHTHLIFGGNRVEEFERRAGGESYQSIAASGGGILSTVGQTRLATEEELEASARHRLDWAIRNGTTTIEIKSGYGLSLIDEIKILRVAQRLQDAIRVVPTFLGAHEIPEEFRGNRSGYIDLILNEMLPVISREKLAEYVDVFCESHLFSLEETAQIVRRGRALGLPARLHVDQLQDSGGAALAASLGAATADHLECTNNTGIEALKQANVQPVLLPGSVYALGSHRYAPAREMIAAGLPLVLASDFNPGSSPTPSIPMVISLAVTQMKLSVAEAITATTVNAAHSLSRGHLAGSLEPGKTADFVIHQFNDYRELGYYFGVEPAEQVFMGGRCVYAR